MIDLVFFLIEDAAEEDAVAPPFTKERNWELLIDPVDFFFIDIVYLKTWVSEWVSEWMNE